MVNKGIKILFSVMLVFGVCGLVYAGGGKWSDQIVGKFQNSRQTNVQFISQNEPAVPASKTVNDKKERALSQIAGAEYELLDNEDAANYAIYQSEYSLSVEDDIGFVKGKVVLEVFKTGRSAQIPLVSSQVGLKDISLNKKPCFVTRRGGKYYVVIDSPGRYNLDFEFFTKVNLEREKGPGSLSIDIISSPITIFNIDVNLADLEIFTEPSIKIESRHEKDKTLAVAILPYTEKINVRWNRALIKEVVPDVKLDPKIYAEVSTLVSLGDGVAKCKSFIDFSILQTEIANLKVFFPEDVGIINVSGNNLRNWKVSKDGNGKVLDVYLNYGVKGNYALIVDYERNTGVGSVSAQLPQLKVLGAEREKGYIGVETLDNIEVNLASTEGASLVDVKELPRNIWQQASNPLLLGFKYLEYPYSIIVDMIKHKEIPVLVATIDNAEYITLVTKEGKVLTKAVYRARNNVKQFLKIELDKNAEIWSCFIDGRPVKPAKDEEGNILIPLKKSQKESQGLLQFPIEIVYLNSVPKFSWFGTLKLSLPKIDIPQNELYWKLNLPFEKTYVFPTGDLDLVKGSAYYAKGLGSDKVVNEEVRKDYNFMSRSQEIQVKQFDEDEGTNMVGILPIKIDVPQQGRLLQFKKLLITDEKPKLAVRYLPANLKKALFFILFALIIIFVLYSFRRKKV